jgi:predicted transcriptional regulator
MVTLTIEVEEATEQFLRVLAEDYDGNMGRALDELFAPREGADAFADEFEAGNEEYLRAQLERSMQDIAAGRVVDWETVKSRSNL